MSYTSGGLFEVVLKKRADLNTTGDVGAAGVNSFAPAFHPYYIRAIMAVVDNTIAGTGQVTFDKRITVGTDTGRLAAGVGTLNFVVAHVGGTVVYKGSLNVKVSPGEEVIAKVITATGAGDVADLVLLVEPAVEMPLNNTKMVLST